MKAERTIEEIKLEWQQHNREHGMSWNEVAELVNECANYARCKAVTDGEIEWAFKDNAKWELADRTKMMNFEEFKAAITQLTRGEEGAKERYEKAVERLVPNGEEWTEYDKEDFAKAIKEALRIASGLTDKQ